MERVWSLDKLTVVVTGSARGIGILNLGAVNTGLWRESELGRQADEIGALLGRGVL